MTKSEMCVAIVTEAMKTITVKKQLRAHCVPIIKERCGMTDAGASTYFSNAVNTINGKEIVKKVSTNEPGQHTPFVATGVDPSTLGMYSVVTIHNDVAINVSAHHGKDEAVQEGRITRNPVVNGLQVIGMKLGSIEKGTKCLTV